MTFTLAGFGTACPEHSIAQDDAAEMHATFCKIDEARSRTLRVLYRRAKVRRRHSAILDASDGPTDRRQSFFEPARDEHDRGPPTHRRMEKYEAVAPGLAAEATRRALAAAEVQPRQVTHLVTVSCTGFIAPGLDTRVVHALGLPPETHRTHVGFMGCQGALNGLRVARSFAEADPGAVVAVCAVELCSLHFAYGWDPEMLVPNALFGDGAGAVVGFGADGRPEREWRMIDSGTFLFDETAEDMTWRIGDHGFRMTLSPRIPDIIEGGLLAWLESWLGGHGLTPADVASWAVHPGGPRILGAVEQAVGLGKDRTQVSRDILADHGNMSSATILFILDRLMAEGAPRPCVALAFGPGLVVEAALFA